MTHKARGVRRRNVGGNHHVFKSDRSFCRADKSGGVRRGAGDRALDPQIPEYRAIGIGKGRGTASAADIYRQGMTLTVKGTLEAIACKIEIVDIIMNARHCGDRDVGVQADGFTFVSIRSASHAFREQIPVLRGLNKVRLSLGAFAGQIAGSTAVPVKRKTDDRKRRNHEHRGQKNQYAGSEAIVSVVHKALSPCLYCADVRRRLFTFCVPQQKTKSAKPPYQTAALHLFTNIFKMALTKKTGSVFPD